MSEILSGGGGTPLKLNTGGLVRHLSEGSGSLTEEERKKILELYSSFSGGTDASTTDVSEGDGAFKNAVDGGGYNNVGNASAPLADYLNKTGGGPTIDYEYKPYEMPPVTGNGEGGGSFDGVTGGEDYSDLLTPSGTPMPGHPNYEAWMSAGGGGDGGHNDAGEWTGSGSGNEGHTGNIGGYSSWTDMWDGGGAGKSGVNFEGGVLSDSLNNMGVNPYGYNETAATNFETKDSPSNYSAGTSNDMGDGNYSGGNSGGDFSFDSGADNFMNQGGNVVCPKCGKANCGCGYSQGGSVQYRPNGGSIWDTKNQLEIAMNVGPQRNNQAPATGGGGESLLGGAGKMASGMIVRKVLGTMLGGPLGMLASQGGPVQYKEQGGSIGQRYTDNQSMWKNPNNYRDGNVSAIDIESGTMTTNRMPAELQSPLGDPSKHYTKSDWYKDIQANPSMWKNPNNFHDGNVSSIGIKSGQMTTDRMPAELQSPLGDPALHRENKKTSNSMKVETHTKDEARKDMKFAVEEKRKQELHEKKMRVI